MKYGAASSVVDSESASLLDSKPRRNKSSSFSSAKKIVAVTIALIGLCGTAAIVRSSRSGSRYSYSYSFGFGDALDDAKAGA